MLKDRLLEAIGKIPVIDAHEHLPPEADRLAGPVDVFTFISHYTRGDLGVARMTGEEFDSLSDRNIPLETRWQTVKPFWERIRHTSYSRAALLAVKKFYGFDEINDNTYAQISEAMQAANKPGIYERVVRETCNIRACLNQCGRTDTGADWLIPLMPLPWRFEKPEDVLHPGWEPDLTISSLEDYLEAMGRYITRVKAEGAVGIKIASFPSAEPNKSEAEHRFEELKAGKTSPSSGAVCPLINYVMDLAIKWTGEQDMTVAVHTGYWGDFRTLAPVHIIPYLFRHPNVRFDIYHLGYPWVREALMLGKGFPNVWTNFAWLHIISQKCGFEALDEAFELLPTNKILGFGGDYGVVEKIYGHLTMARENIAAVLAGRIQRGQITEERALEIARMWLYENARELYRLRL